MYFVAVSYFPPRKFSYATSSSVMYDALKTINHLHQMNKHDED